MINNFTKNQSLTSNNIIHDYFIGHQLKIKAKIAIYYNLSDLNNQNLKPHMPAYETAVNNGKTQQNLAKTRKIHRKA